LPVGGIFIALNPDAFGFRLNLGCLHLQPQPQIDSRQNS
jgi:hypothetical protein